MTNTKDKSKYVGEFVYNYKHNGYDTQTENSLKSIDGLTIVCRIKPILDTPLSKLLIGFRPLATTDLDTISKFIKIIFDMDYEPNNLNDIVFDYDHIMMRPGCCSHNVMNVLYNNIPEYILQELVLNDVLRASIAYHPNASEKIKRLTLMIWDRSRSLRVEEITNTLNNEHQ